MVTNQDAIDMETAVGLVRSNITPIERLLKTTVGRKDMLVEMIQKLEKGAAKKGGHHYLFIGPRGIGKTHFLSLIQDAVRTKKNLNNRYTVLRFPEENNRILSFADLILCITEILAEVTDDSELHQLYRMTSEIVKDEEIIDKLVPRLKHYKTQTGKRLLLLIENFDTLITEQVKHEQDIHRLRSFLMDSPCATLVGTSTVYFPELYNTQSPLYEFFEIQVLDDLTETQVIEMIKRNLEWEKCSKILKVFDSLIPKIQALHIMTGGNPRLIMMLYELIAHDNLTDVKIQLQKLLDQISPFYQDRLKELAPQERALVETISLIRSEHRTPVNISRQLRKPPQQVSSLLKRMTEAGYLTAYNNPDDKRSRIYRIKDGFFDLWLAMSESCMQRKRFEYLVEFFQIYFSSLHDREQKRKELWSQFKMEKENIQDKNNDIEMLDYLSEIGDDTERFLAELELVVHRIKEGDAQGAKKFINEVKFILPKTVTFQCIKEQANRWGKGELEVDVTKWLDEMIEHWKTMRSGDLEKTVEIAQRLGNDISERGLHKIRVELLMEVLPGTADQYKRAQMFMDIAASQKMDGQLDFAMSSLLESLKIYQELRYKSGESVTFNNISQIYVAWNDYDNALDYLKQSLKIANETGDKNGQISTLHNMAMIALERKNYKHVLDLEFQAYRLAMETKDAWGLFVVGQILGQLLIDAGLQNEGVEILKTAYRIGNNARFQGVEKIKELLGETYRKNKD